MGFPLDCEVVVKQEDDDDWVTRAIIRYTARIESFEVPEGSRTDFASVPRVFVWFLPRYGRYTKAAILHDYLWRQRAKNRLMPWRDADAIFRRAMRDLGVPFLRRWMMWTAVRWAALKNLRAWKEPRFFLADLPRMLLFTAVAAPIVVPPAVVILGSLVVWLVVEAVVWLPLKAVEETQRLFFPDRSRKQVNAPQLDFKS